MPRARKSNLNSKTGDSRVVWSSDDGDRRRPPGPKPSGAPGSSGSSGPPGSPGAPGPAGAGGPAGARLAGRRVEVRRETAGRRGKAVTTVRGLPLDDDELRATAARLKRRCGVGGSAKGGVIELQGDHRNVVVEELMAAGYRAVLAGG